MQRLAGEPEPRLFRAVPAVSTWCSVEHLDHLVKVSGMILRLLITASEAAPLPKRITPLGRLILVLGWIPRGRGKSPTRARGERVTAATLQTSLQELDALVERLDVQLLATSRTAVVPHPKFGGLTPSEALRFVVVHNEHHLRIIRDIEAWK